MSSSPNPPGSFRNPPMVNVSEPVAGHKECVINVAMGAIVGQTQQLIAIKAGVKIIECARLIRQKELNSQNLSCGVGKSLAQEPIGPNRTKDCKMVAGMRFV